jgi:nucleotide-binding universal stress UspA family protein
MTYATLLVHLQSGQSNATLLSVAGAFADRFGAHVIGMAACQPMMIVSGDGTICGDVFAEDQRRIADELDTARREFQDAMHGRGTGLAWRSDITITAPATWLAIQSRSADLILTGHMPRDAFDLSRVADAGSLVLEAGRPTFIVPRDATAMCFDHALVAWKDTRECRRATADALPMLKSGTRVTVLEIAERDDVDAAHARVDDVVQWLARHGVPATARVDIAQGSDIDRLRTAADDARADFIVAGAYGHSRLREWVLGGVTRDLLLGGTRGVLASH